MQDVIEAVILARLLYGYQVMGFFNDADKSAIAGRTDAVPARIYVRGVVADGTEDDLLFYIFYRRDQTIDPLLIGLQQMKSDPLGRFMTYTRQTLQLVYQARHRLCVI